MKRSGSRLHGALTILVLAATALLVGACREEGESLMGEPQKPEPAAKPDSQPAEAAGDAGAETAAFAAGCFWGVEAAFRRVKGVTSTAVGYSGGTTENPTYEAVCSGRTGHAETVRVQFDPQQVSYDELLEVFWNSHDPTTLNRQGPDIGTQYRSAIFFHTPEQETAAKASKAKLEQSGKLTRAIVTEITPAPTFYRAEEYHQKYLEKQGKTSCSSTVR